MALVPLSTIRHAGKVLIPSDRYGHAAGQPVFPVVGAELARAALAMPLAFVLEPIDDRESRPVLCALVGTRPGENLFVAPDGRWLGAYIPAVLRRYPFALVQTTIDNTTKLTLAVDEDAGRLGDGPDGLPLFDSNGGLSSHLQGVLDFLQQVEAGLIQTAQACSILATHNLLVPWDLKVEEGEGSLRAVTGLMKVDEARLNNLSDQDFLILRHSGALVLTQIHLMSLQQVSVLSHLTKVQSQLNMAERAKPRLDEMLDFGSRDDITFTF